MIVRDGRSYVALTNAGSGAAAVTLRQVITGRRQGTNVEIVRDLACDERVGARGGAFLNGGDTVRIVADRRAGAGA